MSKIRVKFLGSGDAFGSGNRLQSCILIDSFRNQALLECGASSMVGLRQHQIDCNSINLILVSNLHGDHFGGIPYFIMDAQLNCKRTSPLMIAGPVGIKEKFPQLMEATFPGSGQMKTRFPLEITALEAKVPWQHNEITVLPFPVIHAEGDPHLAFRISCGDIVLAYSGDTEWTDNLVAAAAGADLLILESYFYDKKVPYHLDYQTILTNLNRLEAKNLVLTHMSENMLGRLNEVACDYAQDGKVFEF